MLLLRVVEIIHLALGRTYICGFHHRQGCNQCGMGVDLMVYLNTLKVLPMMLWLPYTMILQNSWLCQSPLKIINKYEHLIAYTRLLKTINITI